MDYSPLLDIQDLHTDIEIRSGVVHALSGVDLYVNPGETLGIVGESGSGKTMTALSLMGLLPQGGRVSSGSIFLDGQDLTKMPLHAKRKLRGTKVGMIFQDPLTSLNPTMKIGLQVCEPLRVHKKMSKKDALERAVEILKRVGMPRPEIVINNYPHQLSGGMRQRVMIAMALACNPKIIIADEPTTALDVTIQAQILDLLRNLKDRINSSIMLITHDLGVIAEMADYVVVMYAGRVVEKGTVEEIFAHPSHPYTIGLMASKPVVGKKVDRLYSIPGKVPNPVDMPDYCYFKDRCEMQLPCCSGEYPCEISLSPTHKVSCYRYYEENRKAGE